MQLSVNCNAILHCRGVGFVEIDFCLNPKPLFSAKKCKSKKLSLIMTHRGLTKPPYDARSGEVVNRAKFDVCMPNSFEGIKTVLRQFKTGN